jgi:hypothetical protein
MPYFRQKFLSSIHFITISLSIIFIPNVAYDYEIQEFIEETSNFTDVTCQRVDITCQDYIDKHMNAKSRKKIQEYKEQCILLQQKGDLDALLNEINRLYSRTCKTLNINKHRDNICLAIIKKIYSDPITTMLHAIAHAPLEKAAKELEKLICKLLKQAVEKNITQDDKIKEWIITQYGFDVRQTARNCYISHNDHIDITQYESIFSDNLKNILSIIQHKNLPIACAELIHLKKQINEYLVSNNITDPIAQKNFLIKNFNCDVIELAYDLYRERLDHKNLIGFFESLGVQETIIMILNNQQYDYVSRSRKFDNLAYWVFYNAKLCNLNIAPEIISRVYEALNAIKKPCDRSEFVSSMTLINNVLDEIQGKVYSIVDGKPLSKKSSELFTQAIENFFTRTNQH